MKIYLFKSNKKRKQTKSKKKCWTWVETRKLRLWVKKKLSINPVEIEENVLSMMLYLQKREKENASKNRDKMLRTDDKTLTNINICVIFFFRYKKQCLTLICYGFTGFFSFQWSVSLLIFRFFLTSMLTVRWFFLAQFSNFRSLSRRKFAHIFYTYTNFRRNKKKSQVAFLFPNDFDARDFFFCNRMFFNTVRCQSRRTWRMTKKTEGNRKKTIKNTSIAKH